MTEEPAGKKKPRAPRKNKPKAPQPLASDDVMSRLRRAAEAAELSIEELANLVFDAGVVPPPAKDGITERFTLKDLGERLFSTMQNVPRSARAEWYGTLAPSQQVAVVVVLREQGYRTEVIARELDLKSVEVQRTWNNYASELGSQVVGIRLDAIAGQVQMAAERAQQMAVASGDHGAFWRIEKEKVAVYQSLGIVDSAIRRVEVTHKLDDQQRAELDALASLHAKKDRRRLEIEQLKSIDQHGDALPDDITEDYDEEED